MNASSNANTLIGYKMSYYRSMYGIDICNADLNNCFLDRKNFIQKKNPTKKYSVDIIYMIMTKIRRYKIINNLR